MASFKKRGDSWQATIYVGRDENGKQLRKYVTKPTLKECKAVAREIEQEIEEGKFVNVDNMRVVGLIEQFLDINKSEYSPGTIILYKGYLKNHYKPFFKNMKIQQLNEVHVKKFKTYLLEKMKPNSAKRVFGAFKTMLRDILKDKSPAKDVPLPKENKPCSKAPSSEEFLKIRTAAKGTKFEAPILCAGWCGFRRGEIFALKPNDLDFKNNKITIDESYSKNEEGKYELGPPKSENGYRTEVAPQYLIDLLKKIINREIDYDNRKRKDNVIKFKKKIEADERIFKGRPDNFSSDFAEFIRENNLPKYRFHDLRHYHATWLYENDVPDLYAAKRMGQTVEVLKNIYQHLGLEKQKEIEEKILGIDKTADK